MLRDEVVRTTTIFVGFALRPPPLCRVIQLEGAGGWGLVGRRDAWRASPASSLSVLRAVKMAQWRGAVSPCAERIIVSCQRFPECEQTPSSV